jgi:antibiotic biosynthesis monooxygenase (ABM) superfamily enzyme
MGGIPGFRGADVLRSDDGGEVGFVTLTRFDNIEAIRAFAGEDYEKAVIEPAARALLAHHDGWAQHYETKSFQA